MNNLQLALSLYQMSLGMDASDHEDTQDADIRFLSRDLCKLEDATLELLEQIVANYNG